MNLIKDINEQILEVINKYAATELNIESKKKTNFLSKLFTFGNNVDQDLVNLAKQEIDVWVQKNYISPQIAEELKSIPPSDKFFEIFDKTQEIIKIAKGL